MNSKLKGNSPSGSRSSRTLTRRALPAAVNATETPAVAEPRSVLLLEPFTDVTVDAHAGHLLIDLQSTQGSVRMQLTRNDLPAMLKTLIDAIGQLAALAE